MNAFFLIIAFFAANGQSASSKTDYPTLEACQTAAQDLTADIKAKGGTAIYSMCAQTPKAWPGKS